MAERKEEVYHKILVGAVYSVSCAIFLSWHYSTHQKLQTISFPNCTKNKQTQWVKGRMYLLCWETRNLLNAFWANTTFIARPILQNRLKILCKFKLNIYIFFVSKSRVDAPNHKNEDKMTKLIKMPCGKKSCAHLFYLVNKFEALHKI